MSGIVWNYRGIGHSAIIRQLKGYILAHRPSFIFLPKTKCNDATYIANIVRYLGFDRFDFVLANGKVGDLLIAWLSSFDLQVVLKMNNLINCIVACTEQLAPCQLTLIYGSSIPSMRPQFLESLEMIGKAFNGDWAILWDFNMIFSREDKKGGRDAHVPSRNRFRQLVDTMILIDLGYEGRNSLYLE